MFSNIYVRQMFLSNERADRLLACDKDAEEGFQVIRHPNCSFCASNESLVGSFLYNETEAAHA